MKWLRSLIIFDRGNLTSTSDWEWIHSSYVRSIESVDFPQGSGKLKLRRKFKRPDGQWDRNGVGYLKYRFVDHLVNTEKWKPEASCDLRNVTSPEIHLYPGMFPWREPISSNFGDFDFVTIAPKGLHVAIEWETGNISSSHRTMNKLAIALASGNIDVGVLIVPSRQLYEHLTDRTGNISELSGYLLMWKDLEARVEKGLLVISVVEHDEDTDDISYPYLPSGNDGLAKQGSKKRAKDRKLEAKVVIKKQQNRKKKTQSVDEG